MPISQDEMLEILHNLSSSDIQTVAAWIAARKRPVQGFADVNEFKARLQFLLSKFDEPEPWLGVKWDTYWKERLDYYWEKIAPLYKDGQGPIFGIAKNAKSWKTALQDSIDKDAGKLAWPDIVDRDTLYQGYLEDTEQLLDDLLEIIADDFNQKMASIAASLKRYLSPHKDALSKLEEELQRVTGALVRLKKEENIIERDKEVFLEALESKRRQLTAMYEEELGNLRNTSAFVEEIRNSESRFRGFLEALKQKREEIRSRKDYLSLIDNLGMKIDSLSNIFDDLSKQLKNDMNTLRETMLLFDISIGDSLIRVIEDHATLTGILGTEGRGIYERIEAKMGQFPTGEKGKIAIDLSFLEGKFIKD